MKTSIDVAEYIRPVSGAGSVTLDPTDGLDSIAHEMKTGLIFYADHTTALCDFESEPTGSMRVTVYQMVREGDLKEILCALSPKINNLCLTPPQIIQFLRKHRRWLLGTTNFLFKWGDTSVVTSIGLREDGKLVNSMFEFPGNYDWKHNVGTRIVVPKRHYESLQLRS